MYKIYFKIIFDKLISIVILIFLVPVFFILMLILRTTGEGEIFFLQDRIGLNFKKFKIIKFATMLKNSPYVGDKIYTAENDDRILPFGKILRKTKLNETLQIFNILLGDMSLVGPRPLIEETFKFYSQTEQDIICSVKPGITGLSSVFFSMEEQLLKNTSNKEKYYMENIAPIKQYLEKYYIDNISFNLDLKIILCTFLKIVGISNRNLVLFFPKIKDKIIQFKILI